MNWEIHEDTGRSSANDLTRPRATLRRSTPRVYELVGREGSSRKDDVGRGGKSSVPTKSTTLPLTEDPVPPPLEQGPSRKPHFNASICSEALRFITTVAPTTVTSEPNHALKSRAPFLSPADGRKAPFHSKSHQLLHPQNPQLPVTRLSGSS